MTIGSSAGLEWRGGQSPMSALMGYLVVTLVTSLVVGRLIRVRQPPDGRRPTLDLPDVARKVQSVLSSLAGFAVTSLVLFITLSGSRLDMTDDRNVDLIALLVVAYLGFVVGAIMYAHTEPVVTDTGLDLLATEHAVASGQFFRSIVSGWFALGPLVAILGVERLNVVVIGLLFLAVLGGWIFHAANLIALGYGEFRFAVLAPLTALVGAGLFAALVQASPGLRATDSVLFLVVVGALLGASAHFLFHALRLAGPALPSLVARWIRPILLADAHASVVFVAFLWLAIARLI
jgi:hypothetical protein